MASAKSITLKDLREWRVRITELFKTNLQTALRERANLPYPGGARSSLYEDIFGRQKDDGTIEVFARDYINVLDAGMKAWNWVPQRDMELFITKRGLITGDLNKKWRDRENKKKIQIEKLNKRLFDVLQGNKNKVKPETIVKIEEGLKARREELKKIQSNFKKDKGIENLAFVLQRSLYKKGYEARDIFSRFDELNEKDNVLANSLERLVELSFERAEQLAVREANFQKFRKK